MIGKLCLIFGILLIGIEYPLVAFVAAMLCPLLIPKEKVWAAT